MFPTLRAGNLVVSIAFPLCFTTKPKHLPALRTRNLIQLYRIPFVCTQRVFTFPAPRTGFGIAFPLYWTHKALRKTFPTLRARFCTRLLLVCTKFWGGRPGRPGHPGHTEVPTPRPGPCAWATPGRGREKKMALPPPPRQPPICPPPKGGGGPNFLTVFSN